ncbi:MAG: WD40 repeat domain-containing protein [Acetobacteraceae bacterium]|jgi:hypothetical protein
MSNSDFFGDNDSDFLFQNSNGSVALWDLSGISVIGGGLVGNPGPGWQVEGTAGGTAITPGSGSFTDAAGNVYTISADGDVAEQNGAPISLGGGTAKLVYYGGLVFGEDATTGDWFIHDADGSWSRSVAPGLFGGGSSAIVLQNNDGSVALWNMSGTAVVGGGLVANPGPTWHVKGTNVFFTGGSSGIVLQNDDGSVALWEMNGISIVGGGLVANPGPGWQIEGTGNFFNDGNNAILFQNSNDGSIALWEMNGTSVVGGGLVGNPGPGWQIEGTGNFFGDGHTDIVFQNTTNGSVAVWDMNGTTVIGGGLVGNPGPTWHIKGAGSNEISFQNDNGSVALWQMSGTTVIGGGLVGNPGTGWSLLDNNMRFIYGTSANETLAATPASPDEFVLTSLTTGSDTISGFSPAQDMIEFSKAQFASVSDVLAATTYAVSGGATINLPNGSSLLLPGVDAGSLHASNFALA